MTPSEIALIIGTTLLLGGILWKLARIKRDLSSQKDRTKRTQRDARRENLNDWLVAPNLRQASLAVLHDSDLRRCRVMVREHQLAGRPAPANIYVCNYDALSSDMIVSLEQFSWMGSTVVLLD